VSADLEALVEELLRQSLAAWRVGGEVSRSADGALLVAAAGRELRVTRAQGDMPFRWMVGEGERTRGVTSVVGLLRTVRATVDPGYRPARLRFAPTPLALP
jgi:hypothetical protein